MRTFRGMPCKRRSRPKLAIDALDAVITAGQNAAGPHLERRVVKQLARMLHARVLFHRRDGEYLYREAQSVHTLSSWSMLQLARETQIRARKVRRRREFWRPEQRRPRGVLCFPIGPGVACIARGTPFGGRDVRAVRTVLRFLKRHQAVPETADVATQRTPPREKRPAFRGLIGSSKPWLRVLDSVWKVAPASCSVLLEGETGTGKELLARAIHLASKRARGPFIAVNCAAVNAETMHSELFGHIRGSFTGADRNRRGLVRQAHRGTLFLDEIGDMPGTMQVALLRALEQRAVRPIGSARERPADVRIVGATNRDLEALVESGEFREDLYHRVNVMTLRLPPLRERMDDLPELAQHVLGRIKPPRQIHVDALAVLARYDWPGNVRELDNVLQAAALLSQDDVLGPEIMDQVLASRRRITTAPTTRLAPRAESILRLLRRGWRSAPHVADRLGVSTRTVNREIRRLAQNGLVESSGEARARRYRAR
ncbi:MAG: sigma-54 dependent transcriptional regulator [Planctomycetota bacterium]|nr:sigma-54 dependent transcriptional regulator [Planctomycetota bacterium]